MKPDKYYMHNPLGKEEVDGLTAGSCNFWLGHIRMQYELAELEEAA